ncbi:hypothetical protein KDA_07330 [Dictyobacter alpinus]|uniref:Alkyl hydroperoxide reductase subunit C/ Thiol specific antioxidant domain-containing protein n=1 Tax=Dictyobacter alpinus TaxID=2014873 RepID=A0A402B1M9_9CHLR|nr:redoxin domain-containing protein [Dictyobacter alpinus]GCE25249.1 hypothetical protein KDA_07330 [Dictyobacter alpinus]
MSNIDHPHVPALEPGQILPAFSLPGADGMPHSPWDYKQREHLVILFLTDVSSATERALLQDYARAYANFREEQCAVLAVTANAVLMNLQTQEELRLPFPLLSDVQGKVITRYTQWNATEHTLLPCIILADRYSALYRRWIAENISDLPGSQELLDSLQYLNKLCTP